MASSGRSDKAFIFSMDVDWVPGSESGLEGLLDFCRKRNMPAAYFFAGRFAQDYPDLARQTADEGHDIGTHGWEHGSVPEEDFRLCPYSDQRKWLDLATATIEAASGVRPTMFRAPNLSVSEATFQALEELGYTIDSSVPSRRYDFGIGAVSYTKYFSAPTEPYHPDRLHLGRRGQSPIVEVPPSSFIIPVNMSFLRQFGMGPVMWAVRRLRSRAPMIVFYGHPAEFVDPSQLKLHADEPARSTKNVGNQNFVLVAKFVDAVLELGYTPKLLSKFVAERFAEPSSG